MDSVPVAALLFDCVVCEVAELWVLDVDCAGVSAVWVVLGWRRLYHAPPDACVACRVQVDGVAVWWVVLVTVVEGDIEERDRLIRFYRKTIVLNAELNCTVRKIAAAPALVSPAVVVIGSRDCWVIHVQRAVVTYDDCRVLPSTGIVSARLKSRTFDREHSAVGYDEVSLYCVLIVAEVHAPLGIIVGRDSDRAVLRSHDVPAEKKRKEENETEKENVMGKRDCTGTTNTTYPPA